jgi:hypothetical protein
MDNTFPVPVSVFEYRSPALVLMRSVALLLRSATEPKEIAHLRIVFVVQQLGAHLDPDGDFRFNFNKPRQAIVRFTQDNLHSDAAICTATCIIENPATIAAKLATPFNDEVVALGLVQMLA